MQGWDAPPIKTLADYGVRGRESAIVVDCEQGKGEWFSARLGRPTGSNFGKIVTKKGKATTGKTRETYRNTLLSERLTRSVEGGHTSFAMERGNELEPKARGWYSFEKGCKVHEVGFVYFDERRRFGVSPDGIAAPSVGLEIKCPMGPNMVRDLIAGAVPDDYIPQVQGEMWVCGLECVDYMSWTPSPDVPNLLLRVEPDLVLHAAFEEHINAFCDELDACEKKIRERLAD
jgi:hypothetical protein